MSNFNEISLLKEKIKDLVESTIQKHGALPETDGYRSTGLAVIDAVFSANARYESVEKIIKRLKYALSEINDSDPHFEWFNLEYLIEVHDGLQQVFPDENFEDSLADRLYLNRSIIGGERKAIMVDRLARQLLSACERISLLTNIQNGVGFFESLWQRSNRLEVGNRIMDDLTSLKGIGPATSRYLLLLLGGPYVKPDVMTTRFVLETIGKKMSESQVSFLLETAINQLLSENCWKYTVPQIDHLIWRFQSGRPLN